MITTLRLVWRMQRWEVLVLIGGPLLLAGAIAVVAWQTSVTLAGLDTCYAATGGALSTSCTALVQSSNGMTGLSPILVGATTVAPFIVGILLGAPLVSHEIEKRTAPIAWSLSLSRVRWLAQRTLPLLIAMAIVLLLLGAASEALIRATPPGELGFRFFAMHGPLIAMRGIAVFVIGVVVGLLVGRMLPAILATGLVVIVLLIGLQLVREGMMRSEAIWTAADDRDFSGVMIYGSAYSDDTTGQLVTDEEAYSRFPDVFGPQGSAKPPGLTQVYLATPPERYPIFVARGIGELALISLIAAGLAVWIVGWRRPDVG